MKLRIPAVVAAAAMLAAPPAFAQQMVYTPINPTFGGNPFNSQMLSLANAQNLHLPVTKPTVPLTQGELFAQELQSQLLSALAQQVTSAIFGQNPQQSGNVVFGGETINFVRGLGQVTLTITDQTGAKTVVQVPTLVTANNQ